MTLSRRSLITGLISLVAAPAIVRAGSLMPVKAVVADADWEEGVGTYRASADCQAILIRSDPSFGVDISTKP